MCRQTLSAIAIGSDWIRAAANPRTTRVHWTRGRPVVKGSFANTIQPGEEDGDRRNTVGARKFVGAGQVPSAADPAGGTLVDMATPVDALASLGDLIGSQRRRPTTPTC